MKCKDCKQRIANNAQPYFSPAEFEHWYPNNFMCRECAILRRLTGIRVDQSMFTVREHFEYELEFRVQDENYEVQ